jgi:hypothetical protein
MPIRYLSLLVLALPLAVLGYFFFGIVVAIYAGLWLHDDKMYYAQGLPAHLFGAVGAAFGALIAWGIWRLVHRRIRHEHGAPPWTGWRNDGQAKS